MSAVRGISLSVNGFRNEYDNERDDGVASR